MMKALHQKIKTHSLLYVVMGIVLLCAAGVILSSIAGINGMALDLVFVLFLAAALSANLVAWPLIFQKSAHEIVDAKGLNARHGQARRALPEPAADQDISVFKHFVLLEEVQGLPEAEPITGIEHLLKNYPFAPLRGDLFELPQHMRHGLQ